MATNPLSSAPSPEAAPFVVLVDDDSADTLLAKRAFQRAAVAADLQCCSSAKAALELLERLNDSEQLHRVKLMLVDINMPGMNGLELLAKLKSDPRFARVPAAMLTTSNNPADLQRAQELHANAYFVKPNEFHELVELMRTLSDHWLRFAKTLDDDESEEIGPR